MNTNLGWNRERLRPIPRLGRRVRIALAILALGLVAVLTTARLLTPDPKGFGTHTQLGLGRCAFREITGKPCPSCGMTTAFAWAARGRLDRAWRANPAGSIIAPTCLFFIPWLIFTAISGRTRPFRSADLPLIFAVLLGVGLTLSSWAIRLFFRF